MRGSLQEVRYIVIHHSGVDVDSTAESIARYHVESLGWPGIGYHFLAHQDGGIEYVGDIMTIRYNVASRNHEVVGVCLPGNWMDRCPSLRQLEGARSVVRWLRVQMPWARVVGHREIALDGSVCPGDTWPQWKPQLDVGAI